MWLDILQGLTTPVIGLGLLYIAYQQYKTNREKLKLDLYERRLRVFRGTTALLGAIQNKRKADLIDISHFLHEAAEATFLFSKDTALQDYLEEIRLKANKLWAITIEMNELPVGEQRNQIVSKRTEQLSWFIGQWKVIREKFKPHLGFK